MNYCTACGKQNPEIAKFCTGCGAMLKSAILQPGQPVIRKDTAFEKTFKQPVKGKKNLWLIIGLLAFLALGTAFYFLFINNPRKKPELGAKNEAAPMLATDSTKKESNNSGTGQRKNSGAFRNIPKPLVPIVKAANVLPKWTENEDINGNHSLIRLYIGAIGKKPIKLFITGVDTINNLIIGYSNVGNNTVMFEGPFTRRERKASTNEADNYVDAPESIFEMTLFEPESINSNGVFKLEIHISDLFGGDATGSWVSYDGKLYREIALSDIIAVQMK